jgi:hypothetical protein
LKNITGRLLLYGIAMMYMPFVARGQFPPPAGQPGSTAIFKDTTIFVNWAKACTIHVGYINISDTSIQDAGSNKANFGVPSDAIGKSDDHVVSLGDGGFATLFFDPPIADGQGFDFAVFENGLNDTFLELAFVEVSSDGEKFVRFPSSSLTAEDPQIATFGSLNATNLNNLAGKYRVFYGTPFDLNGLSDSSGLDILHISNVRVIDVVGCMKPGYSTYDSFGHKVNDPWPTNFYTGGFDLDAVGVIHEATQSVPDGNGSGINVFPNPCSDQLKILNPSGLRIIVDLVNFMGKSVLHESLTGKINIDMTRFDPGMYIVQCTFEDGTRMYQKVVKQ